MQWWFRSADGLLKKLIWWFLNINFYQFHEAAETQQASGEENRRNAFRFGQFGGSLWAHYLSAAQEEQCNITAVSCSASAGWRKESGIKHIFWLCAWTCSPLVRLCPGQVNELMETPPHDAVCSIGVNANLSRVAAFPTCLCTKTTSRLTSAPYSPKCSSHFKFYYCFSAIEYYVSCHFLSFSHLRCAFCFYSFLPFLLTFWLVLGLRKCKSDITVGFHRERRVSVEALRTGGLLQHLIN